ncbi:hypothetical protein PR202_gb29920 [Eleusine coracana subsp. coracana]|uniref:Uncharacterized protein n=1 Tax=Eleusine coracana subsp. coracana TaxID=191504 RepID=A0AAV5FY95_ELECO|nr:hypothetical protein PR202_gb29920 [Eleusine coracana subsp. coracana]
MASVYIPVQGTAEEVRVALDQLPNDASDILDILKAEQAPLHLWLIIAREYFKQGKIEQFRQILEEGSGPEIDEYYAEVKYERIAILNALGAFHTFLGKVERAPQKEAHFKEATQYYNRASRIDETEPSTWIGKGQLCVAKGELQMASDYFKIVLDEDGNNFPALLGQLDPENVDALVALAIMDLQTNEAAGIRRGMEKMKRAFEIYPYCTLALNHLANHYFFTGQHFVVEQLTETALSSSNHGLLKSQAYYNLARSYHSKGDIDTAGRYYLASVNEITKPQDFVLPYIGLGQIQLKLGDYKRALASFEKVLEVHPENCESLKAFVELGELLVESDWAAAMEYLKTARNLLKKAGEDVPVELLNGIGLLHFEKGELEMAEKSFKEALGSGLWVSVMDGKVGSSTINWSVQYKDQSFFHQLEEKEGVPLELHSNKVTPLFNYARLLEELHDTVRASLFYRFIIFKYPDYVDAYLRLAAIAKQRNNIQQSMELIGDALKIDEKNPNALSMLGSLELQCDETWLTAKEHFRIAKEATKGDAYSLLQLREYFKQGKIEQFRQILEEGSGPEIDEYYAEVKYERIAILNALGQLCVAKGELQMASDYFKIVLDEDGNNFPALLGQLDPENVDALVALAIMDLQTNEAAGIRRGMEKMKRAFEIYPYCTLALNHLANHYFFTGQHFVVEQLTETALSSSNHGLLKSQAYYNLARSYHSKGDIDTAGRYYLASVNEITKPQDFVLPYIGLGQIQLKLGDYKRALASFEKVLEVHPENCESLKAFVELGELLVESDWAAAMEYLKTARNLLKKAGEDVPVELLNGIGLLHFEKGELEVH